MLGSSIDEALQWAQQAGNLDAPAAQLVKDALAQKDQSFSGECTPIAVACFEHTAVDLSVRYAMQK